MSGDSTICTRAYLERVIDERDRTYADRFRALEKLMDERGLLYDTRFRSAETSAGMALASHEKSVNAAFAASEKAIVKAEESQKDYNNRSNEFRQTLDDWQKNLGLNVMPRPEILSMLNGLEDKISSVRIVMEEKAKANADQISSLRESRSEYGGKDTSHRADMMQRNWTIGIGVAIVTTIVSVAISLAITLLRTTHP